MPILGQNQYGKAENRVVRITRDGATHHIKDLNVSVALSGDMEEVHYSGSNANVLPTDAGFGAMLFFLSPRHSLQGRRPLDLLRAGQLQGAVAAAERHDRHGAY